MHDPLPVAAIQGGRVRVQTATAQSRVIARRSPVARSELPAALQGQRLGEVVEGLSRRDGAQRSAPVDATSDERVEEALRCKRNPVSSRSAAAGRFAPTAWPAGRPAGVGEGCAAQRSRSRPALQHWRWPRPPRAPMSGRPTSRSTSTRSPSGRKPFTKERAQRRPGFNVARRIGSESTQGRPSALARSCSRTWPRRLRAAGPGARGGVAREVALPAARPDKRLPRACQPGRRGQLWAAGRRGVSAGLPAGGARCSSSRARARSSLRPTSRNTSSTAPPSPRETSAMASTPPAKPATKAAHSTPATTATAADPNARVRARGAIGSQGTEPRSPRCARAPRLRPSPGQ
jgi:hypothetical protein